MMQAEGVMKRAELNVEFTQVTAPITGRISRHLVSVGNLVQGGDGGATLLTSIVSLDPIYIYFDMDEATYLKNNRLWSRANGRVRATPPIRCRSRWPARPSPRTKARWTSSTTGWMSRPARCAAARSIPNTDLSILPGQFGRVRLIGSSPYEALLLPDTAIATDQSRKIVFVVKEDDTVEVRPVVLGPLDEGLRVIREGLKAEDKRHRRRHAARPRRRQGHPAFARKRRPARSMNLGRLSINQPILAMVLSIVLLIVGALAYTTLPVAEYPQVVPPTVVVTTQYPGASAQTVSDTVAAPIEQQINGVEDMLYLYSQATSNGQLTITVTFKLGTDLDKAQVLVQNRVAIAQPQLPEEVQRNGVITRKNSPDILMVVFMLSPDNSFDQLYISNYALLQVRDQLLRLDGVGDIQIFGARDYSMRLWLDPDKISNLGMTAADVLAAIRAQNLQITGGQIAEPPIADRAFQPNLIFTGRLKDQKQFEDIVVKAGSDGRIVRLRDVARDRARRARLFHQQLPAAQIRGGDAGDAAAGIECARDREEHLRHHDEAEGELPEGARLQYRLQPDRVHRPIRPRADQDHLRGDAAGRHRGAGVPAGLAAGDHSDHRDPGVAGRHLRGDGGARLLHQQPHAVRPRARGRHRGRRRHRGGRECRAASRARHEPARRRAEDHGGGRRRAGLDRAGAVRGVRADGVPRRHFRAILPAIRRHHCGGDRDLLLLLADAVAGAGLADPHAACGEAAARRAGI